MESGAVIKGDDVRLIAKADSRAFFDTSDFAAFDTSTWGDMAANTGLGILEGLLGVVSVAKSTANVDVKSGATIDAKGDFEARASSFVNPVATPVIALAGDWHRADRHHRHDWRKRHDGRRRDDRRERGAHGQRPDRRDHD